MTMQETYERNVLVNSVVSAVCPIDGVSFATDDPATWEIQPSAGATATQIAAGNAALRAFDASTVAEKTAKRKRIDATHDADANPSLAFLIELVRKQHDRIAELERAAGKVAKDFAAIKAETAAEFIAGDKVKKNAK